MNTDNKFENKNQNISDYDENEKADREMVETWGVKFLSLNEISQKEVFKVCVWYEENYKDKIIEFYKTN